MDEDARRISVIIHDTEALSLVTEGLDRSSSWYEKTTWVRALIQVVPGGGSLDMLLARRGTELTQQRIENLIFDVDQRLSDVVTSLNIDFVRSDQVFELFRTCAETVARSASEYKRGIVADFFAGTLRRGFVDDLSQQIAEDIRALQELHLQILVRLPVEAAAEVDRGRPEGMSRGVYMKAMADLERMGFVYYVDGYGSPSERSETNWHATEYVALFKEAVLARDPT